MMETLFSTSSSCTDLLLLLLINRTNHHESLSVGLDGNETVDESPSLSDAPTLTGRASIKASILAVMAGTSFLANGATLLSIAISRKNRGGTAGSSSTLYSLLFQLAVADLLVSIWCLSGEAAWTYTVEWKGGEILCKIFKFSQVFSLYLSTSTMILIGFDRLLAIRKPISHRSCVRPIAIAWIVSALLASPQLAVFRVLQGPFREPFYQCVTYGFYTEEWQEQLYSIFSLLTMFVIPLVALVACYVCIFYTITKEKEKSILSRRSNEERAENPLRSRRLRPNGTRPTAEGDRPPSSSNNWTGNTCQQIVIPLDPRRSILQRAKMKSLRISVIIVTAFIICWAPYYFMMITFIFLKPDEKLGEELQSAIFFFGMSNSLINPLIYGAFHLCRPNHWNNRMGAANRRTRRGSVSIVGGTYSNTTIRDVSPRGGFRTPLSAGCHQQRQTCDTLLFSKDKTNNSLMVIGELRRAASVPPPQSSTLASADSSISRILRRRESSCPVPLAPMLSNECDSLAPSAAAQKIQTTAGL